MAELVATGEGETANQVPVADGSGGYVWASSHDSSQVKTGAYNILAADSELLADTSAAAFAFTLPTATGSGNRKKIGIAPAAGVLDTPNLLSLLTQAGDTLGDWNLPAPVASSAVAATASGQLDAATHYYVLTAVNDIGETLASNEVSAVVAAALLQPPVISSITTLSTGGFLPAGTYTYVVTASNAAGETVASATYNMVVPAGTSTNTCTVNWAAVTGATSYKVYRNVNNGLPQTVYSVGNVTSYVDGTAYSSTNKGTPPDVNLTGSKVTVSWSAVPGARFYRVYHGTSAGAENQMYEAFGTSFVDQGLPPIGRVKPPAANGTLLTVGTPWSGAPYSDIDLVDAASNVWRVS